MEHPNRWLECERAIEPRFNELLESDLSATAIFQLVEDAIKVGWTDYEVKRALWGLKVAREETKH
jgi:hypothetical protein